MHAFIQSCLFKLPESELIANKEETPEGMARLFQVPYLGKLPMDPNMLRACEEGKSFIDAYPTSVASAPFSSIIKKLIEATKAT